MVAAELPELRAQFVPGVRGLAGAMEELHEISRGIHPAFLPWRYSLPLSGALRPGGQAGPALSFRCSAEPPAGRSRWEVAAITSSPESAHDYREAAHASRCSRLRRSTRRKVLLLSTQRRCPRGAIPAAVPGSSASRTALTRARRTIEWLALPERGRRC